MAVVAEADGFFDGLNYGHYWWALQLSGRQVCRWCSCGVDARGADDEVDLVCSSFGSWRGEVVASAAFATGGVRECDPYRLAAVKFVDE